MKTNLDYQICTRCVMDNTSDPHIYFDEKGICNYCKEAIEKRNSVYFPNIEGEKRLKKIIAQLKKDGKNKKYDCVMGLSGGLDSSYLAYLGAKKWGLRILAFHIDDGYDTQLAKENIKNLCDKANIELITIEPDAKQFNDLTRAYILAEVPNIAIPQDNVLFAYIYEYIKKYNINYFLSGNNFALESILQKGNTHGAYDTVNIKNIHKRFGKEKIDKILLLSEQKRKTNLIFHNIKTLYPLNYINYNKKTAIKELNVFSNFSYYEAKHLENILTKFIQLYWFYKKFNVDKRRSHFSSLIISDQMTRSEALKELKKPMYDPRKMEKEINFILKKLDIPKDEFDKLIGRKGKQHTDYKFRATPTIIEKIFWAIIYRLYLLKRIIIKKYN